MEPSGQHKEETSNQNAPVFFTMAMPNGKKAEPENKAGQRMKGKAEGTTVKGKVRQWAGVVGTGKQRLRKVDILYIIPWRRMGNRRI